MVYILLSIFVLCIPSISQLQDFIPLEFTHYRYCWTRQDIVIQNYQNITIINQTIQIQMSITHTNCSNICNILQIADANDTFVYLSVHSQTNVYHIQIYGDHFEAPYQNYSDSHTLFILINSPNIFVQVDTELPVMKPYSQCSASSNETLNLSLIINELISVICIQSPPKQVDGCNRMTLGTDEQP